MYIINNNGIIPNVYAIIMVSHELIPVDDFRIFKFIPRFRVTISIIIKEEIAR